MSTRLSKIKQLREQKKIELEKISSRSRTYSKGNKREPSSYRVCLTCKRILYFKQYRTHNEKYKSHGWPDPENKRRLSRCKLCEDLVQKKKRDRKPWWRLNILAKGRAKKNNLPYNINDEDIKNIWPLDNKCPILGTEFKSGIKNKNVLPTLDKIIPSKGYVRGNIAVISFRANQIKSDVTDINVFKKLYEFYKKK